VIKARSPSVSTESARTCIDRGGFAGEPGPVPVSRPAARLLEDASDSERRMAIDAVRRALAKYAGPQGLRLPNRTWIVMATPE